MKTVVFIGTQFPEPHATAAGWRILQIISFFQKNGDDVCFLATSEVPKTNAFSHLKTYKIKVNCVSFDGLIQNINPDVVVFDRFLAEEQFGWRVSEQCPKALKVLDTEDLHFLRKQREDLYLKNKISSKTADVFKREIASILRCDLSLIISQVEYKLLTEKYNISASQLFYLPFVVSKTKKINLNPFSKRKDFIFIGNFLHEPNWQTVLILKTIWPEIRRQLPDAELHIYGAYMPEKAKSLHDKKNGFLMKGRAENVEQLYKDYKVLLAPIPYGAGLKGKLFESMLYGLPNVTTAMGAEGLNLSQFWNGNITDNLESEFIKKAIELYTNEDLWQIKQGNGYEIINQFFMAKDYENDFIKLINTLINDLTQHREQHFLIGILNHQSMQSTKYMSQWIEEKSKRQVKA